ncbi:MAG: hypothetical protein KGZ69_01700, partial [Methylomonas sp.]|nr:hypothetical protein [Methylomonas sp.]
VLVLFSREHNTPASGEFDTLSATPANPPSESVMPALGDPPDDTVRVQQRMRELHAAEALKQQQDAALQRFEERRRQETAASAPAAEKAKPLHLEHMRSLCAEWGATMECQELRKNQ